MYVHDKYVPGENECQKGTEEPGNGVTDCELLRGSWKANSGPKSSKCSQPEPMLSLQTNHPEIHVLIIYSNMYDLIT